MADAIAFNGASLIEIIADVVVLVYFTNRSFFPPLFLCVNDYMVIAELTSKTKVTSY